MAKNPLDLFLYKDQAKEDAKSTFTGQLFKKASWFPNLVNDRFNSVTEENTRESVEINSHKDEPENNSVSITIKKESSQIAPKGDVKKPLAHDSTSSKKGPISSLIPSIDESINTQQPSSNKFEFDLDFEKYLLSISDQWKLEDIAGFSGGTDRVKAIFFGLDTITDDFIPETAPISLIESSHDLLGKMIMAMGLKEGEFARVPIIDKGDSFETLVQAISFFKPKLVISLGASATNISLGRKLKLSNVHGSFHTRSVLVGTKEISFNVAPLFHPQLLEINQSMKKTAWVDMQAMMKFIEESI